MAFRQIKTPALANQAVIETKLDVTAVSGQTPVASISAPSLDSFLIHDSTSGALRKVTASSFIGSFGTDDLTEGSTNLYFTDARAQTAVAADIATAVAAEATDRAAADTTLQGNIDTLSGEVDATQLGAGLNSDGTYTADATTNYLATTTSLMDADNKLDAAIKAVDTAYQAADTSLQTQVDFITNNVDPAALDSLTEIVSAFQTADSTLSASVIANTTLINNETTRATDEETRIEGKVDTTQSELDATQVGSGLGADGSYTASGTANYISASTSLHGATVAIDSALKAVDTAYKAADTTLETSITANTNKIGSAALDTTATDLSAGLNEVHGEVDAEASRALTAEGVIAANLVTETNARASADTSIRTDFAAADSAIQGELDLTQQGAGLEDDGSFMPIATGSYVGTAVSLKSAIEVLDSSLAIEEDARIVADGNLDTRLTTEEGNVDTLQTEVQAIEDVLGDIGSTPLDTTATTIGGAINEVHGEVDAIDARVTTNEADIATNLASINNIISNTDAAALDSLTEIVTAFQNADSTLTGLVNANAAAVNTVEASVGLNADGTYAAHTASNYINTATSTKAALGLLDTQAKTNADNLTTEIADRTTAVSAEATARASADVTLQGNIDTESARALAAEGALDTRLTSAEGEITATQSGAGLETDGTYAADATTNYLTAGTSLKDADKKLDTAIKAEETRALAAEGALDTRLTTAEGEVDTLQTFTGEGTALDTTSATLAGGLNEVHGEVDGVDARLTVAEGDIATNLASINNIISNTDPAALDSLTEIVTAFQNADTTLTGLVQANLDELNEIETGAGLGTDGTYTAPAGTNYLATATSLSNADEVLDTALKAVDTAYKAADAQHDTDIAARLPLAGGTMTGALDMGNQGVTNLAAPTLPGDAVNLGYMTSSLSSQHISAFTSDDLAEGSGNLYYLDSRSRAAISLTDSTASGAIASYDSSTGVISVNADHSVLDATDISDTSFTGQEGKVLAVNGAEDGMELIDVSHLAFASANRITINGDGTTQTFALGFDTTQVAAMVFVGGVVQDPTTHYSIDSTAGTITFTDPIPTGSQAVVISHMLGAVPYIESNSVTFDKFSADIKAFVQKSAVSATTGGTPVDTFSGTAYRSAKYIIQVDNGAGEYETREALVVHDGTTAYITEYALVFTGSALLGDATVAMNGNDVQLFYTATSGTVTVKVISTYLDV